MESAWRRTRSAPSPACGRTRVYAVIVDARRTGMLDLLQGIRIISFNHFLLGPMGIQALADLGADVIAVEAPEGAWQRHWSSGDIWHDGQGMLHLCSNRNKRSVALDLKAPKGRAMALTGQQATGPRPVGVSAVDHHGAALFAMGILAALVRRERTGKGCRVDASLMQAALDLQAESLVAWLNAANRPATVNARQHIAGWYYPAPYGVYATRNGHIAVSLCPLQKLAQAIEEP